MGYRFTGSTHRLIKSEVPLTTWPMTLHGRLRLLNGNDQLDHCIIYLALASNDDGFRLMVAGQGGQMRVRCASKAAGAASAVSSTTYITDANWHSCIGEITSANTRQCWLDAGGNASQVVSRSPGTPTRTLIGAGPSGASNYVSNVDHDVADVAVWAGTLNQNERQALSDGVSPLLIRPDILKLYAPVVEGNVADLLSPTPFTLTGATASDDHPQVIMPARSRVWPAKREYVYVGPGNRASRYVGNQAPPLPYVGAKSGLFAA